MSSRKNGYQRVPTESDDDIIRSCSGSGEEEGVSASRSGQERDETIDAQRQLQKQKEINNALQIRISEREERIMQHIQEIEFMRTRFVYNLYTVNPVSKCKNADVRIGC